MPATMMSAIHKGLLISRNLWFPATRIVARKHPEAIAKTDCRVVMMARRSNTIPSTAAAHGPGSLFLGAKTTSAKEITLPAARRKV